MLTTEDAPGEFTFYLMEEHMTEQQPGPDSPLGRTLTKIAGDILGIRVTASGGTALRIHLTDESPFDVYVPPVDDEDPPAKP